MKNTHQTPNEQEKSKIPNIIWFLGISMFFINFSYMMVFSLSGLYFKNVLKLSGTAIGVVDSIAESASFLMKLVSGIISDYFKNRKFIMVFGYFFTLVSRIFLAMATSFWFIITSKMLERLGNGIQGTPRDALVTDVAPPDKLATCFGLKRTLGVLGSLSGGVFAFYMMIWTQESYEMVFYFAPIPAFVALLLLAIFVREPKHAPFPMELPEPNKKKDKTLKKIKFREWLASCKNFDRSFWLLMIISFLFMSSRVREVFLPTLAHEQFGLKPSYGPLIAVLYNIFYCLCSYPVGIITDKVNRYKVLAAGVVILIAADLCIMHPTSFFVMCIGIVLWGVQMAITQNVFLALIGDMVPEHLRGTGYGIYYFIQSIACVVAGYLGGLCYDQFGHRSPYIYSCAVAVLTLIMLLLVMMSLSKKNKEEVVSA